MAEKNPNIYTPSVKSIIKCYDWGDELLSKHGNEAYSLIKFWEPIVLGSLISRVDSWGLWEQFLNNMKNDYHAKAKEL